MEGDLGISGCCEITQRAGKMQDMGLWHPAPAPTQDPSLNELCDFGQVTGPLETCFLFCKMAIVMLRACEAPNGRKTLPECLLCIRCPHVLLKSVLYSRCFPHFTDEKPKAQQNEMKSPVQRLEDSTAGELGKVSTNARAGKGRLGSSPAVAHKCLLAVPMGRSQRAGQAPCGAGQGRRGGRCREHSGAPCPTSP